MKIHSTVITLLCLAAPAMYAQVPADTIIQSETVSTRTLTAKGTVLDESGEPIIGATVSQRGNRKNMTVTDADGHFSLSHRSAQHRQMSQ